MWINAIYAILTVGPPAREPVNRAVICSVAGRGIAFS